MDYETSKIVRQITPNQRDIRNVVISPDGLIIAFKYTEIHNDVSRSCVTTTLSRNIWFNRHINVMFYILLDDYIALLYFST